MAVVHHRLLHRQRGFWNMEQITKFGYVDYARHARLKSMGVYLLCFFNGVDVTNRCRWANDETGEIFLYKHNAEGKPYVEGADIAAEQLKGNVQFKDAD